MKLIKYLLLITALFGACNSDPCGNTGTPVGKYISNDHSGKELYLLINKDSTFLHYYKDINDKVKSYEGKWKISIADCRLSLSPWRDLEMENSGCPCSVVSAQYKNDKIQPHIDVPIYRKVD
jgi:hypothetical protein